MVEQIEKFLRGLDNTNKEEYWETDLQHAQSVMVNLMKALGLPVWKVKMIWDKEDDYRAVTYSFALKEIAEEYVREAEERPAPPVGRPTRVEIVNEV